MDLNKVAENLKKRGFEAQVFAKKEDAAAYINSQIDASTVGFGGSVTSRDMGLYESLSEHNTCYWHWKGNDVKESVFADYYISSVNGMTESGQMILIDGKGNRVGAVLMYHKKVFFVVGKNKIEESYEKAMWRARNVATGPNARRLGLDTPCAKADKCFDCNSKDRMCNYFLTIERPSGTGMPTEVLLIDEELGF